MSLEVKNFVMQQRNLVSVAIEKMDDNSDNVTLSLVNHCKYLNLYGEKAAIYLSKVKQVQDDKKLNEKDALLFVSAEYMPELLELKFKYDRFISWLKHYRQDINQLVQISFEIGSIIPHEQTPNKNTLMCMGSMYIDFFIEGEKYTVDTGADVHLALEGGRPTVHDVSFFDGNTKGFDQVLDDVTGDQVEVDNIERDIEDLFYEFFNHESIPLWQHQLINSFVNQDILNRLKQL